MNLIIEKGLKEGEIRIDLRKSVMFIDLRDFYNKKIGKDELISNIMDGLNRLLGGLIE